MSRTRPECLDPETFDRSVAADVLVRQEPDEEEEDEKDDEKEKDEDDEEDEGYSPRPVKRKGRRRLGLAARIVAA